MSSEPNLDHIRRTALNNIDTREKKATWILAAAATVEGVGLILYLVLMDFSDRLHWLILIAACLVYGTVTLALFSVGAEMKASVQRILRAIEEVGGAAAEPGS